VLIRTREPFHQLRIGYSMVILDNVQSKIDDYILDLVQKFNMQHGEPKFVGMHCCLWSEWLTTNFNLWKWLQRTMPAGTQVYISYLSLISPGVGGMPGGSKAGPITTGDQHDLSRLVRSRKRWTFAATAYFTYGGE